MPEYQIKKNIEMLKAMDLLERELVTDEYKHDEWLMYGVPDEADDGELREIAESPKDSEEICRLFMRLIRDEYDEDIEK